jgi:ketosteroid isomerase-like protein
VLDERINVEVRAMPAQDAKEIVGRYHEAWKRHDFEAARAELHDDLSFQGPFDTFERADDYINAVRGLAAIVTDVILRKTFVDGDDVCLLYDMVTNTPAGTQPIAEWYRVRDGKIGAIQVYFDSRPFAALREG